MLLLGPSGSGKSDLLLRLLDRGFTLVADDRVSWTDGVASAPTAWPGCWRCAAWASSTCPTGLRAAWPWPWNLAAASGCPSLPARALGRPLVHVDPAAASAPSGSSLALDCALGRTRQLVGAFA